MEAALTRLSRLVAEVESKYVAGNAELLEELASQLGAGLRGLTELISNSEELGSREEDMMEACSVTLKRLAVRIWNESVSFAQKRNGGALGATEVGGLHPIPEFSIHLRQVASEMLLVAVEHCEGDVPIALYSYAVRFSARTGKLWADRGEREKANGCWDRVLRVLRDVEKGEDRRWSLCRVVGESAAVAEPLLQLCVWKAECNLGGQIEAAEDAARMALFLVSKKSLGESEEVKALLRDLAILLYNLGVRTMKRSEDGGESGERWFMGVLALQRGRDVGLGAKFRADALRALARCNLDAVASPRGLSKGGALERAIKYLEQAQELHNEPVGQLLLIEAYWMAGRKEGDAMFEGVLNGRKVELSKCQSLMSAVTRSGRGEIVEAILERSMEEGKGWSENELSELRLMQLEVLVNAWKAAESTERLDCRLERVVDDCIRRCEEAETACEKNEQRLYVLCWELATECYKARKWTEAIRWFERVVRVGLSWAGREERVELKAKCLCLLAKCYLNLESLDEALKCGESALEAMPTFLPGLAVLFELYLKQDRIEGIHEVINKVMRIDEAEWGRCKEVLSPIYLIEMLIGQALEYQRSEVTLKVLEALLTAIGSREKTILQRLKLSYGFVLRTALKMMWTELAKCECRLEEDGEREGEGPKGASLKAVKEWINRAGYLIRKASQVLKKVGKVLFFGSSPLAESGPRQDEELTWMSHYSFNLAVKAQNYKLFENAHDLFIESAHFCKRTEVESAEPLKQQRKCRVLAISSILLMYTSSPYDASRGTKEEVSSSKMKKGLEGALQHVLLCYRLTERISEMSASTKTGETSIGADKVKVDCNNIGEDGRLFEDENSMRVLLFLLDFELRVLLRHPSQELFSLLNYREDFAEPHIMIRALENLSWFIWERHQGRYSLRLVGLELCYRLDALYRKKWSSSKSDQGGLGHDLLTWLSNLRRAVSFCPDKSESLQIYRRISELLTLKEGTREEAGASEDVQRQVQWLVIEAYNNGVYYSRLGKYEVSAKWLATAISLLPYYVQKNEFEGTLLGAHEQVLKKL